MNNLCDMCREKPSDGKMTMCGTMSDGVEACTEMKACKGCYTEFVRIVKEAQEKNGEISREELKEACGKNK